MAHAPDTSDLLDEEARRRFELAWRQGVPRPIDEFLPAPDTARHLPTLEELVMIDLEMRWRNPVAGPPPRVEEYLERFPRLAHPDVLRRLLDEEIHARVRHGDRPDAAEYRTRFPDLAIDPEQFRPLPAGKSAPKQALPDIPGYEIAEELGRGGMGVVFKARQKSLNRVVAVKTVFAGAAAAEVARFLREAEAIARLQHPHVVQIHDIGESDGQPYFSMEFVPGGSLAQRLRGGVVQSPREAARVVEQLTSAVEYVHGRGIVHRDLKPANVLLAGPDGGGPTLAGGGETTLVGFVPKVSDFGLARAVEADSGLTQTGAVIGTPSYMAPEQASGLTGLVGPAVDVYALGAILYELMTGRPPFRGATVTETIEQVLTWEPVSPTSLQPRTPRDLETICLKCLAKDPPRRYPSAAALAADLRRFLAGEPIHARPVGRTERLARWARRRPAVAALTAAVVVLVAAGLVTSAALTRWAFRERDAAQARLDERVQTQVDQLVHAAPEVVPGLLPELRADLAVIRPRLDELWANTAGDRRERMRAGLALVDTDPAVRAELADWMVEAENPREVLLTRWVLAPWGAALAERMWARAGDLRAGAGVRFRALVALAEFDPNGAAWEREAPVAADDLLKANALHLGDWLPALRPIRARLTARLTEAFRANNPRMPDHRRVAATVLADYAADQPAVLASLACEADAEQFAVLEPAMKRAGREVVAALTAEATVEPTGRETEPDRVARAKRRAKAAAALVTFREPAIAWALLKHSSQPDARTAVIPALAAVRADAHLLLRRLDEEQDASARAALVLALGEYTAELLPPEVRTAATAKLLAAYRHDPDPEVHGAIDWLLRHGREGPADRPLDWACRKELERADADLAGQPGPPGCRWFVDGQGQTLVAVRGPVQFMAGSPTDEPGRELHEVPHRCTIGRSFAVASKAVTLAQWDRFLAAMKAANLGVKHFHWDYYTPDPDGPIVTVSWYEAAMYCRWLSEQHRVPPEQMVYPPLADILKCADGKEPLRLPTNHLSRTGYRLPTKAEFEYACRAGMESRWPFGGADDALPRYAWFLANSENRTWPVGQKRPNALGLFDMIGNAWTWCQDGSRTPTAPAIEDVEDNRAIDDTGTRILRGGSFLYRPAVLRSAFHEDDRPSYPGMTIGLRVARTLPPDHFAVRPRD